MPRQRRSITRDSVFRTTGQAATPAQGIGNLEAKTRQTAVWLTDEETDWIDSGAFGDSYASRRRRRCRSNTRSNVPLYLAQRSANISLLLASYHQAPERLRRT